MKKYKRILLTGDWHCGSIGGLTPPKFEVGSAKSEDLFNKRREMWNWWEKEIDEITKEKKFDLIVINGDAIDGEGSKSGGREQLFPDRDIQCDMAFYIVDKLIEKSHFVNKENNVLMTLGSLYHVGNYEDWEKQIVKVLNAKHGENFALIDGYHRIEVNGLPMMIRHHAASSPGGMKSNLEKEHWSWIKEAVNIMGGFKDEQEDNSKEMRKITRVLIGSHIHKAYQQKYHGKFHIITLPALQIPVAQGKLGRYMINNPIDLGFGIMDINDENDYSYEEHLINIVSESSEVLVY